MKVTFSLLQEKIHFLKKFYLLNLREYEQFSMDNFANLTYFNSQRDNIIEILIHISDKIEKLEEKKLFSPSMKINEISALKNEIALLSDEIMKQDMDILSLIESKKSSIIKELQKLQNGKKVISSYKSPQTPQRRTHGRESDSLTK